MEMENICVTNAMTKSKKIMITCVCFVYVCFDTFDMLNLDKLLPSGQTESNQIG